MVKVMNKWFSSAKVVQSTELRFGMFQYSLAMQGKYIVRFIYILKYMCLLPLEKVLYFKYGF